MTTNDSYVNCENFNALPEVFREVYELETELVCKLLKRKSRVLQVGPMDGHRMVLIQDKRPDLHVTGLEIDEKFVKISNNKLANERIDWQVIHGDITKPPKFEPFDWVICLNNTLGWVENDKLAVENMKKLAPNVIISLFTDRFTEELAEIYFPNMGFNSYKKTKTGFKLDSNTTFKTYSEKEILAFKPKQLNPTPLGYFCVL